MPVASRYSNLSIAVHWLMALLIVAAFALGAYMTDLKFSPAKLQYYSWHKWLGVTVLGLAAFRLLTRLLSSVPAHPTHLPTWQKKAASTTHVVLYILMFAVPLSGYFYTASAGFPVVYLGLFPLPTIIAPNPELKPALKELHELLTSVLFAFVALHVAAALKHQCIDKDGLLKRMWPSK